ncbi:hypothetical protein MAPG_08718 [Magnaporthiopsis poae ATCC 64411]|uniref:Deoxyribonuclease NucA/NucB domain-containing protein n=1 Tax=Magnaporthiopsis poae (strain ATCC 64411 / 73-15) TaxID=644358 RepID=A0A0C4E831_MAGP6|nr:hypothetical protein MAPG_08718 [Magnaporthiopsis poae ATCC 64411]
MRPLAIALVLAAQATAQAPVDFNKPFIFDWNCAESVESCENACYAVKQGLAPDLFTFDADANNWEDRSRRSGADSGVCNDMDELARNPLDEKHMFCQEFPPPSTQEGGEGAVLRCVRLAEKLGESVQFNSFYNHIIPDGGQFEMIVRNFNRTKYCRHDADMAATPFEFTFKDGLVVDAQGPSEDRRAFGSAANTPRQERAGVNLREFEDEYGDRVLSLSRNVSDSLIGRTISNGKRGIKIVGEVTPGR